MQKIFSPTNYTFKFTDDWYEFDYDKSHKMALAARNAEAKKLRKRGMVVRCFTMKNQRMSMGGIGSGSPHIELVVNVYGLNSF